MVRGFLLVVLVSVLFVGCGDELVSNFDHDVSTADRIVGKKWCLKNFYLKPGTHDPDVVVPELIGVIDSGNFVDGTLMFNADGTLTIETDHWEFWLNHLIDMKWEVDSENKIRFRRYDKYGYLVSSFSYNVRFHDLKTMQWYAEGTGIEDGEIYVTIFNFYLK